MYAYVRQANSCSDGEKRIFECAICVFDENENESIGVKGCPLPQPQRQCASRFSLLYIPKVSSTLFLSSDCIGEIHLCIFKTLTYFK